MQVFGTRPYRITLPPNAKRTNRHTIEVLRVLSSRRREAPRLTPRTLRILTLLLPLTLAVPAGAQGTDQPAPLSNVIPPKLASPAEVAYPPDQTGDDVVLLFLTIDANGAVTQAEARAGRAPFTSIAERAALTWRFEPATRDGNPVASRIRFEVRFAQPQALPDPVGDTARDVRATPALEPEVTLPPPEGAPPSTASEPVEPIEVTVYGNRPAVGGVSLGRAEVRQLPGAFGDPFRAIEALPGVTPIVSALPFYYVRGSPPGNVGYFVDGIRVPYLYHLFMGPSVIHPGMVDRVDLYSGAFPANYGRYAGGIVAAETTPPRTDWHGEGNVRLFDAGALVEGGFAEGKGTVLLAGRYSYTAWLLSVLTDNVKLDYRDYETRVTYDLTPNDRISLVSFGAYDQLTITQNDIDNTLFGTEFYRVDTRYDHKIDARTNLRAAVTLGFDQTRIPGLPRNQRDTVIGGRIEGRRELDDQTTVRLGADVVVDHYHSYAKPWFDRDDPVIEYLDKTFAPRDDVTTGAWSDVRFAFPGVEVTPGLRVDAFRSGGASAVGVDPRISSRIQVAQQVHVLHALGMSHQPPSFVIPIPGLQPGSLKGGLQRSVQSSAGVEVELPEEITATATAFHNIHLNMSDTIGASPAGDKGELEDVRALGSTIGIELYVRRRLTKRLGGFVSYTLSRSTRSVGRDHFPSAFDRTHVANAALTYNLGRNWRAGSRLLFYTGAPVQASNDEGAVQPEPDASPPRDPAYYRIDGRIEKRWNGDDGIWLSFVAEVLNATARKEILGGEEFGPIVIPSLGFEGGF